jgi:hypothetical protein
MFWFSESRGELEDVFHFFESLRPSAIHAFVMNSAIMKPLRPTTNSSGKATHAEAWCGGNILRQNENGLDTDTVCSFNSNGSGVPIALIGQEGIRCVEPCRRQNNSGAAPATVGGEPFSKMPLGFAVQSLGRLRRATTREPGDLPELGHPSGVRGARSGRTSAVVTGSVVTRTEAAWLI